MKITLNVLLSKLLAFGKLTLTCDLYTFEVSKEFEYKFTFTKITSECLNLQKFLKMVNADMID